MPQALIFRVHIIQIHPHSMREYENYNMQIKIFCTNVIFMIRWGGKNSRHVKFEILAKSRTA